MGLGQSFWIRKANKEEKEERVRQEQERKTSKTTEEVVAAIGDIRVESQQLAELDQLSKNDPTGILGWIASFTRATRGTHEVLDFEADAWLAWIIRRMYMAWQEKNQSIYDYCAAELFEIFGLVVPIMAPKRKPDIYTLPYIQKPGTTMPGQSLTPQP